MTSFTILTVADDGTITQEHVLADIETVGARTPIGSVNAIAKDMATTPSAPMPEPVGFDSPSGDLAYCGAAGQM